MTRIFSVSAKRSTNLSGINTGLICTLAEKLLTGTAKDIRVATYYCWALLHRDGEAGFAEG
ncbi:hypothetical protein DMH17_09975 [Raoultella planticola]|nr:hypothetical protein [Raoultella planticola]